MDDLDFFFSVIDTNEEAAADPDAFLYAMTDEQFERRLARLHKAKAEA